MFYSQTFLGRKGPLGTVWCAAHLQHRLKKSHYTSTNILKTVDYIMYSEVPIALRMSGHLLLGVVRIYSKQVDYLFQDCNYVLSGLRKSFASVELNLPEDAKQATAQSVTLPSKFELDAWDVDETFHEWDQDNHHRSQEDITLLDQIPTGTDPYIAISFDEDIWDLSQSVSSQGHDANFQMTEETRFRDDDPIHPKDHIPSTSIPSAAHRDGADEDVRQEFPETETEAMLPAVPDSSLENFPPGSDNGKDVNTPLRLDEVINGKEVVSTSRGDPLASGGSIPPFQQHSPPAASSDAQEAAASFHEDAAFALQPSPPMQHPQVRKRKRKQFFDECVVLKNSFMKKALDDPRDILRERKGIPPSALGLWKLNNRTSKERIFDEPITTGLDRDIHPIFEKNFASVRATVVHGPEVPSAAAFMRTGDQAVAAFPDNGVPNFPNNASNSDMDIEKVGHSEGQIYRDPLPDFLNFPSMADNSSLRREGFTPTSMNVRSESEDPHEPSVAQTITVPDPSVSTATYSFQTESPQLFLREDLAVENPCLSEIPELRGTDGLDFLEADNESPAGTWEAREVGSLSVRTRAVAQFLKGHSPITTDPEDDPDLSLDRILAGKRRRLCARMFYETLVLKSHGLIDVRQDEPYGNLKLKLTPVLSKAQI